MQWNVLVTFKTTTGKDHPRIKTIYWMKKLPDTIPDSFIIQTTSELVVNAI